MKAFEPHRVPADHCPHCGYLRDAASARDGEKPQPGDYSVCFRCAAVSVFTAEMKLRPPTVSEQLQMARDPDLGRVVQQIRAFRTSHS